MRILIRYKQGFTLIELSIVLVIIGLIIGGILIGQDMVAAAAMRATLAQIEKYNTATTAFRNKYGGLPGDLPYTQAAQFGFNTTGCVGTQGQRDGNGLIDGGGGTSSYGIYTQTTNETSLFWQDLSTAGLIDSAIPGSALTVICSSPRVVTGSQVASYFPSIKTGQGNYMYVYETGGINWFGLMAIQRTDTSGSMTSTSAALTVAQAYDIDAKIDDGIPNTGHVVSAAVQSAGGYSLLLSATDTTGSCAHNWTVSGYNPGYSMGVNNGGGLNCTLSIQMQGAAR